MRGQGITVPPHNQEISEYAFEEVSIIFCIYGIIYLQFTWKWQIKTKQKYNEFRVK